jgi:hypothetical protein
MEEAMQGPVRDLVFNLDEVRVSEWEDWKAMKVVVLMSMGCHSIHHGLNRNLKYITIIPCVAGSGERILPYLIASHG